ncbi:MAG: YihY/virulence factor BrkB family protein [Desulfomonile tiedjei]|uniref:YihY/virulence factor BrkB family protein n=1 Tax=Desulfomonile tiedjei TaxID=2358 RepID=A0A9D6V9H1_9BACT|nr:YihY/virulence factor BrkB family protein [Desulfomonile tiedjei]
MPVINTLHKEVWLAIKETAKAWINDNAFRMAAALAYYTTFSIGPALLIGLWIAAAIVGGDAAKTELISKLEKMVTPDSASYISTLLDSFWGELRGRRVPYVGVAAAVVAATAVFAELQSSLNSIWGVKHKGGSGLLRALYERAVSFVFVVGIGVLLVFSIVLTTVLGAVNAFFSGLVHVPPHLVHGLNLLIIFAMVPALLAVTYKLVPYTRVEWKDVWLGSAVASILFVIGKKLFGMYLNWSIMLSVYGAAGSLIIFIVWVYYSAQVFFLGAELTKVYARRYGSKRKTTEEPLEPV